MRVILGDRAAANGYGELIVEDLNVDTLPDELNVTKITGDEFGEYETIEEIRDKAVQFYKDELQGKEVFNPILGEIIIDANANIQFSSSGMRKAKKLSADPEKCLVVKHLQEIIENANAVTDAATEKDKHSGEHFYYLHQAIDIGGEKKYVIVTVRRMLDNSKDTLKYYNHSVYSLEKYKEMIKETPSHRGDQLTTPGPKKDEVSDGHSVPEKRKVYKRNIYFQPAWHGSPYTFDKFTTDAIGSGEGAQAHGWGLYFAADKEVSEVYKNLQAKTYTFGDKRYHGSGWTFYDEQNNPIPSESPLDLILRYTKMYSSSDNVSKKTAIRYFEREIKEHEESLQHYQDIKAGKIEGSEGDRMYLDENIDYCERTIRGCHGAIKLVAEKELPANNSRLYEADIPESDVMLDEQKLYSKQPEKVKENLSRAIKELNKERKEKGLAPIRPGNASGRNLYKALSEALGGDKEASLFLNEHGIKGITYEGGRDGRCFVVFDDKAVSILNTYNQEINASAAEARLAEDEKQWASVIDQIETTPDKMVRVMQTPLSMQLVNVAALPVYMDTFKIKRIMHEHPEITTDVLKQIPRALTDPIMILNSDTVSGRMVAILELKGTNDVNVVVPFELEKTQNGLQMNLIKSAYSRAKEENGKPVLDYGWVQKCINTGGLLYVNRLKAPEVLGMSKQKAMSFLSPAGVQFSLGRKQHSSLTLRIPDERDLVKLREQNPTQYQKQGTRYAGQYAEAENLIRIFSAGNASTVIHESAHAWLSMLERLAKDEAEKRGLVGTMDEILSALYSNPSVNQNMIKDLATIREWARYSPEALAEYKGTALEKEFAKHAEDVARGIPGAEERFIQERFARAFERYLMTGKAPAKSLRTPFRRFKAWLTEIYKTVKELGQNDAPKEITRIFNHMLATKEEINAWAAEKKLISQNLPLDYSATEKENIERWQEEVKESAKEKCMASFIAKFPS